MGYGIKVVGGNSQVILDESLPYFGVVAQGTAPSRWTTDGGNLTWITIPSNVTNPLLVIKAGERPIRILMDGNRFTASQWNLQGSSTGVYNYYDWAILDSNRDNWIYNSDSHGLKVLNEDGTLLFDSRAKIFTVDSVFNLATSSKMATTNVSVPTPRFGSRYFCGASIYTGVERWAIDKLYVAVKYVGGYVKDQNTLTFSSFAAYAHQGTLYNESVSQSITLFSGYMI